MRGNKELIALVVTIIIVIIVVFWGIQSWQNYKYKLANTPPLAPAELKCEKVLSNEVMLSWEDMSKNELVFKVFRNGVPITELPKDTQTFIDYAVEPSTIYKYWVVSSNNAGESVSNVITVRTLNPSIRVVLDKIGVIDNGESIFRGPWAYRGEIYLGIVIKDDDKIIGRRLPTDGYYHLAKNEVKDLEILLFYKPDVGNYLSINIVGFEHDHIGSGGFSEELVIKAIDMAIKGSMGTLTSLILDVAGVDFTTEIREIGGFSDDFMGEYYQVWEQADNWGNGYYQDIQCDKGDGSIGLRIWYTISLDD